MRNSMVPKALRALVVGAVGLMMVPTMALATSDATREIRTAAQNVSLAAAANDLTIAKNAFRYSLACLSGSEGRGVKSEGYNPCKGLGQGAIADTTDAVKQKALQGALIKVQAGLAAHSLEVARIEAGAAQSYLRKAL